MAEADEEIEYTLSWSRYVLYVYTLGLIGGGCYFFSVFPSYSGIMYAVMILLGLLCTIFLYVYITSKFQQTCLSPLLVKGRSFLGLYHLALLVGLPLFVLCYLSFGRLSSLKDEVLGLSIATMQTRTFLKDTVFQASDGFVALNSSISIVTTLSKSGMPVYDALYHLYPDVSAESYERQVPNVFYSEAKVLLSPFDEFPITPVQQMHADARDQVTVAPIFGQETSCLGRFPPVHVNCARGNVVLGFAIVREQSLCRDYVGVTMCKERVNLPGGVGQEVEHPLVLRPTYDCMGNGGGLCGRVTSTPSDQLKNEIYARMKANGWMIDETRSLLWVEVNDLTECELNKRTCEQRYNKIGYAAVAVLTLVLVLIFSSLVLDFFVDLLVSRLANDYKYRQIAKINTLYTS